MLQVPKPSLFVVTAFWDITNELLPSTPEGFPAGSSNFSQAETADLMNSSLFFFPRDEKVSFNNT